MENYKNYEDIDIRELLEGESVLCKMRGAQGVDGSKFNISLPDDEGYVKITRIKSY